MYCNNLLHNYLFFYDHISLHTKIELFVNKIDVILLRIISLHMESDFSIT